MTATCPVSTVDAFLARLALSLWVSAKRVEPLPTVRVWSPDEVVTLTTYRPHGALCSYVPGISAPEGI